MKIKIKNISPRLWRLITDFCCESITDVSCIYKHRAFGCLACITIRKDILQHPELLVELPITKKKIKNLTKEEKDFWESFTCKSVCNNCPASAFTEGCVRTRLTTARKIPLGEHHLDSDYTYVVKGVYARRES